MYATSIYTLSGIAGTIQQIFNSGCGLYRNGRLRTRSIHEKYIAMATPVKDQIKLGRDESGGLFI